MEATSSPSVSYAPSSSSFLPPSDSVPPFLSALEPSLPLFLSSSAPAADRSSALFPAFSPRFSLSATRTHTPVARALVFIYRKQKIKERTFA